MFASVLFYGGVSLFRLLLAGQVGWEIFLYQLCFGVADVAGEEEMAGVCPYEYRAMPRGMARGMYECDVLLFREEAGFLEGAAGCVEVEEGRFEPRWI